jgi:hypothetical protein
MEAKNGKKKTSEQARNDSAIRNRTIVKVKALKVPQGRKQVMKEGVYYWVSEDSAKLFQKNKIAKIEDKSYTAKQAAK